VTIAARARPGIPLEEEVRVGLTGARAVAEAMRQTNPDVVAVYPITPSTVIAEAFSRMVSDGLVDTEFIAVESEHSALSACIGAAAAGARAQTISSSQGLALMWELFPVASGFRLPIVLHAANRTLSAPINIHCDHSDTMGLREAGWIQLYGENPQEAYDHALLSVRIAEHPRVLLPVLHTQDGYAVTHCTEPVTLLPDGAVRQFLGEYRPPRSLLNTAQAITIGPLAGPDYTFEIKRQVEGAMEEALGAIPSIMEEFGRLSGRHYHLVEEEALEDAELALVVMGSTAGTVRSVVRDLRRRGLRVGLLKVRCYRPFPATQVAQALRHCRAVGVLDRSISFGAPGNPLYMDVLAALVEAGAPPPRGYVYGIGGRELQPHHLVEVFADLARVASQGPGGQRLRYIGLRE